MTPEQLDAMKKDLIAGVMRRLDLHHRVPAHLMERRWPIDGDLVAVLCLAVVCVRLGARRTALRRPAAAEGCGDAWPFGCPVLPAGEVVDAFELKGLLTPQ